VAYSLQEAVSRGAALLDERRPGWAAEIRIDQLMMNVCEHCILGQLFGDYLKGKAAVLAEGTYGFQFGFNVASGHDDLLRPLWLAEIARRREVPAAMTTTPEATPHDPPALPVAPSSDEGRAALYEWARLQPRTPEAIRIDREFAALVRSRKWLTVGAYTYAWSVAEGGVVRHPRVGTPPNPPRTRGRPPGPGPRGGRVFRGQGHGTAKGRGDARR
jgi:hypothetical protein